MVNEELKNFILKEKENGKTPQEVEESMIQKGYSKEEVDKTINHIIEENNQGSNSEQTNTNQKNVVSDENNNNTHQAPYTSQNTQSQAPLKTNNSDKNKSGSNTELHKTAYVWVIIVLTSIFALYGIFAVANSNVFSNENATSNNNLNMTVNGEERAVNLESNSTADLINLILNMFGVIVNIAFVVILFKMSHSVLTWIHIAFGYSILSSIGGIIVNLIFPSVGGLFASFFGFIALIITVPVTLVFWITFYMHIKKQFKN